MNEQKLLRKQLFKYIRTNMLILIGLFLVFGIFMFNLVSKITFDSVNIELEKNATILKNSLKQMEEDESDTFFDTASSAIDDYKEYLIISNITNPKILCIIRNENGEIINSNIGLSDEDFSISMDFDKNLIDKSYEVVVEKEYYYKGITIDLSTSTISENGYIQLLLNIDTEKDLVQIYHKIIICSVFFGIMISIGASVLISQKSLTPAMEVMRRHTKFVADVSHEIRTPLTIIQAKLELMLSNPEAKIIDKTEDISVALHETKHMAKMTKDLMILSRGDAKQFKLEKEDVDIDEFMTEIAKVYGELITLENKKLILNLEYNGVINIDKDKIYQLMVILIDNATKYTEAGDTIEIHTYQKDNKCVIKVKDTGMGIGDDALKHVFERFYREDKARSRETGGSGLGLPIAYMIVSAHSGTIKASHNGEKGSVFTVKLPR